MEIGNFSITRRTKTAVRVKRQRPSLSVRKNLNNLLNDNLDARNDLQPKTQAFELEQLILTLIKGGTEQVMETIWYEFFGTYRATSEKGVKKQFKKLRNLLPVVIEAINLDHRKGMLPLGIKRIGVKSVVIGILTAGEYQAWLLKNEGFIRRYEESIARLADAILHSGSNADMKALAATAGTGAEPTAA